MVLQFSLLESKKPVSCLRESLVGRFFLARFVLFCVCVCVDFFKVVLVSGVQHSDSDIYIYICICVCVYSFLRFFSLRSYYRTLNMVPCAVQ